MMPGETPPAATTAGIAAEAATACANCGALQQNLNEYVAALVALKQKIIDTDHLLTEYQQKCNELQAAKRENSTLHQQVEQMFQKISPLKKCQEELGSVKAELEEKKSSLKIYQETHLEYARVKEEMDKSDAVKKKLETKVKKLEEAAAKHIQEFKQLKAEKKVLEKELKKAQEKTGGFPGKKQKKVLKNAETQSERENPVGNLNKEKIKLLLKELWMCIDGSTPSQINRNDYFLADLHDHSRSHGKTKTMQNLSKFKKSQGKAPTYSSSSESHTPQTSLTSLQIKLDDSPARCGDPPESKGMETTDAWDSTLCKNQSLQHITQTDLAASCMDHFNKDQEELDEIMRDVFNWFTPLPPLLSPIKFSPAATPDILFGDITDSSDDEMNENAQMLENIMEKSDQSEPAIETVQENHSAGSWNKCSSSSINLANNDLQEPPEKLRKLRDEQSVLYPDPLTATSTYFSEKDATSKNQERHLEENSDFMEIHTVTGKTAHSTEGFSEKTVSTTDRLLLPSLMSINLQGQQETVKPVYVQEMLTGSIVDVLEDSSAFKEEKGKKELARTKLDDWPQPLQDRDPQKIEGLTGGGVKDVSDNIQSESNSIKAWRVDGEPTEQNAAPEVCSADKNDEQFMEKKMNVSTRKSLFGAERQLELVQQQSAEVPFRQPSKKVINASDTGTKSQHVEEGHSRAQKSNEQNEMEANGKGFVNIDALSPELHFTLEAVGCTESLCHVDEVVQIGNECSITASVPTKNIDDNPLKTADSMTEEPKSMDIKKEGLQEEQVMDQKVFAKLPQETGGKSDSVIPAQTFVIKNTLLLSEGLVESNSVAFELENVTESASELDCTENMGTESKCASKVDSVSNSFQTAEISKEEECLVSSSIQEKGNESLNITEKEAIHSLMVGEGEKPSALGTMYNEKVSSLSRNLQCGTNDTSQEMSDWYGKSNSSSLKKYATEETEKNDGYSVAKEMVSEHIKNEGAVPSEQNVSEPENRDIETILTTAVKSTTESIGVTCPNLEVNLGHLSRNVQSSGDDSVAPSHIPTCIVLSSIIREMRACVNCPNSGEGLKGKEGNINDSEESSHRTIDWLSNSKNEVQSLSGELQALIKGYHGGNKSEALTPEASSLNSIDVLTQNKSVQNDEELVIPDKSGTSSNTVKQTLEATAKEIAALLSSDIKSETVDEAKMSENTIVNSPVSDSSEEETCLLRKVDFTKTPPRFATAKDGLEGIRSSPTGTLSIISPDDDVHELSQDAESASLKDGQSAICDTDSQMIAWEHSYAERLTCSDENALLELEDSIATEKSGERQTEQNIPPVFSLPSQALTYEKSLSRKLSARNLEIDSDTSAPDTKHSGVSVETSDVQSNISEEKSSPAQGRSFAASDLEQSQLASCHADDGNNKECCVENKGTTPAVKTNLNAMPPTFESSNSISEQEKLVSVKLDSLVLFEPCPKNGAEQVSKPTDSIDAADVKSGQDRLFHRIPSFKGRRKSRHTLLTETILAEADTSAPTKHCPKTLAKIRQEMGPPLPPLLPPLLATPPRTVKPVSPRMSLSRQSSLPSSLHELVSPLCEIPVSPSMSPLSDTPKCESTATLTTPSPSEMSVGQRTLSSPLQFCATTPKHALPVPGRLPPSAASSGIPSVPQENSVKILDSMYPELSARARTLNILKGNIQLTRSSSLDSKNIPQPVHQISGFKAINSTSTVFVKTGTKNMSYPDQPFSSMNETGKRTLSSVAMPKGAKRPRLNSRLPNLEICKEELSSVVSDVDHQCPADETVSLGNEDATHSVGDCNSELPLSFEKTDNPDSRAVAAALEKIAKDCFDVLPVIRSHVLVGNTLRVPVMRDEEKEVVYELSVAKKSLAEPALQAILNKLKKEKMSLSHNYIQSLCRVYVGICRQLGDLERARLFCYSLLKEDLPQSDRLTLFIGSIWNEIFSSEGVINKAIQLVVRQRARGNVLHCLNTYLNWEESTPLDAGMMISSLLLAIQLCPQMEFQLSEQYGEDLNESTWEYVFAIDLLCSHQKWCWTHDNIISKELWPIMDKWIKNRKNNGNASSPSEVIVATVLRLIGRLGQIGLREGFSSAVENISSVIGAFLQHAKEKDVAWGVQLAAAYALCDLSPSNPPKILEVLQAWKQVNTNSLPPAITNGIADVSSLVKCAGRHEEWSAT
uniref:Little elongation complex subunit 1 isoform X1 n=1 Tax=Pogona vitticeps TaxID=103695 RepID=A0ABM5GA79_9SAUR